MSNETPATAGPMTIIKPTIGRVVWFWPVRAGAYQKDPAQPLAAMVAFVHSNNRINIGYIDSSGMHACRQHVLLVQPGEEIPNESHCTWMPYQIGQSRLFTGS